ncbi:MAG: hypothetical protein HKN25_02990 [Pyrinomonadaceae bacterium]|nr:hypothetical protein [Pyrinomonadaceae bacterium]
MNNKPQRRGDAEKNLKTLKNLRLFIAAKWSLDLYGLIERKASASPR